MKRPARRLIVLLVSFYVYLFIGALTFSYCESGHEETKRKEFSNELDIFQENNTCVTRKQLELLVVKVMQADDNGAIFISADAILNSSQWELPSALFFSATTITTIGYGYITPKTTQGQIICIAYAFFGIPLTGWLLSVIGDMFEGTVKKFVLRLNSCLVRFISGRRLRNNVILLITCTLVSSTILILPSLLIYLVEDDWGFIQAIYFSFITLSTIGFGDLALAADFSSDGSVSKTVLHVVYATMVILYLLLGLGVLAAIFKATTRRYQKNKLSKSVRSRLWGAVKRVLVLMELRRASIASASGASGSFSIPADLASRRGTVLAIPDLFTISENEEASFNTSGSGFESILDSELEDLLKTILQQLARTDDNHKKEFYDMINRASRS